MLKSNYLSLKAVFRLAMSGKKVLYIAAKAPESLPIEEYEDALCRDIMKNIVFSYHPIATDLIGYLMGMLVIQPKPDVVIVDFLHTFFDNVSTLDIDVQLQKYFIECHMAITAGLHAAVDMLSDETNKKYISIVCIDPQYHDIYKRFIQTYVDLYYYKEGCILRATDLITQSFT